MYMLEEWRSIPGTKYSVSDWGNVRNDRNGKILKGQITRDYGYPVVRILVHGRYMSCTIHRLVAEAFLGLPEDRRLTDIIHIDGNRENNKVDNLMWVTHSDAVRRVVPCREVEYAVMPENKAVEYR